jgi:hypothetical protein
MNLPKPKSKLPEMGNFSRMEYSGIIRNIHPCPEQLPCLARCVIGGIIMRKEPDLMTTKCPHFPMLCGYEYK